MKKKILKKNMNMNTRLIILTTIIFILVFLITFFLLVYDFIQCKKNNKCIEDLIDTSIETDIITNKRIIDWEYLKKINSDIIGWIEVEGTNIDYPILQNKYYINHSYDKKYASCGSIFTINSYPFKDNETVIYGHNMKNKSMFSELSKYTDIDFFYSHLEIKIYTPTQDYRGYIFSVYSIGVETENRNIEQFNLEQRIKYYKEKSKFTVDGMEDSNKVVKLSTCSYINNNTSPTNQRYYIIAMLYPSFE